MKSWLKKSAASAMLIFFFTSMLFVLGGAAISHAGPGDYVPISPICDPSVTTCTTGNSIYGGQSFPQFLQSAYRIGIALTFALGVVMITLSGFNYVTTEKMWGKNESRKNIENALIGIGIALASYILLNTINPDLLTLPDIQSEIGVVTNVNGSASTFNNLNTGPAPITTPTTLPPPNLNSQSGPVAPAPAKPTPTTVQQGGSTDYTDEDNSG